MRPIAKSLPLLCTAFLLALQPLMATVDDSHSLAMEAAMPYVEQGFIVREEYWNGEIKSGQVLVIKHQMFKGNEYAFWLGSSNKGVTFDIKVYDERGQEVSIAGKAAANYSSVRVNPPRTGTYTLTFSLSSAKEKGLYWALAYGYR